MLQVIVEDRYSPEDWNIYVAQASDGDNMPSDTAKTIGPDGRGYPAGLRNTYAYLEVGRDEDPMMSMGGPLNARERPVAVLSLQVGSKGGKFVAMRKVHHRREIYPVFRELFAKRGMAERGSQGR
jgi:uncharacterized sporulation protein YeaH/YhbH (DUF444 family)